MLPKCLLAFFLGGTAMLSAHPLDLGLVQLDLRDGDPEVSLDLNPLVAAGLLGLKESELSVAVVQSRAETLRDATLASGPLEKGGTPCRWGKAETRFEAQKITLTTSARCEGAGEALRWSFPFLTSPKVPSTFQVMVRARTGAGERVLVAERGRETIELAAGAGRGLLAFIVMGIEHIGAHPNQWHGPDGWHLPDGLDHILFVVALVLAGGGLLSLVATATGFTIGHSVTLALGALGIVHLPSRLVESAIALSIAVVAAEAFFQRVPKHRWKIATFFGLVHGLGFASAVAELSLSRGELLKALLGFNVGVEIGQAILIAILFPLVIAMQRTAKLNRYAVPACSVAVFLAGSYWFVQRALGL